MNVTKEIIPYEQTGYFGSLVNDYVGDKGTIQSFYKYPLTLEAFEQVIKDKQQQGVDRELLVKVLQEQYKNYNGDSFSATNKNIELLGSNNTFAVTTAHQPNIFLGPLYIVYKTVTSIKLAKQLKEKYPAYDFVPVFWLGSEDHDYAELNHVHLFGKTLTWNDETTGSFGRRATAGLTPLLEELKTILGETEQAKALLQLMEQGYKQEATIAGATRKMLHLLFGEYGLVVIDGDNADLKRKYLPVIKEELLNGRSNAIVSETNKKLEAHYGVQAKPREINLFYLTDNVRSRIVKEGSAWKVLNTDITFSQTELESELNIHPERFSPNVILRALYQETILPSVAVVGGGSETAYLAELKPLFEYFKVNYPVIVLRNSVLWMDGNSRKKWQNTGFDTAKLFNPADTLVNEYVKQQASSTIETTKEKQTTEGLFAGLREKAEQLDKSILPMIEGEKVRFNKFLETFEDKLLKAEKKKYENSVQQIRAVKEKLFPANSLQERYDNFMPYYLKYGPAFITTLVEHLNPLEKQFTLLSEE